MITSDSHLREISQEIPHQAFTKISLKIIYLKFPSTLSGTKQLIEFPPIGYKDIWKPLNFGSSLQ